MKIRLILLLLSTGLFLAACQAAAEPPNLPKSPTNAGSSPTPPPTPSPAEPTPAGTPTTPPAAPGYPAPSAPAQPAADLWLAYPPVPGDDAMQRAEFFVDGASLLPVPGAPGQFDLAVEGSLPTPCHKPRVEITPPDAQNKLVVTLYALAEKDAVCAQVLQPFEGKVATLRGYPPGKYTVRVNEVAAGEMTVP